MVTKNKIAVVLKQTCPDTLKNIPLSGKLCVERMQKSIEEAGFNFLGYKRGNIEKYEILMEIEDCYPLLTKDDLIDIYDYFLVSNKDYVGFFGGFITNYREKKLDGFEKLFPTPNAIKLTFESFSQITYILQDAVNSKHIKNGVLFIDKNSVYVDEDIIIKEGTVIYPNCFILGKTKIGKNCKIYGTTYIENCEIFDDVNVVSSNLRDSVIKSSCNIGPFAYIRPKSVIGENCKIGDFVEVKNSVIKDNTKASHLSYIGDAKIGENCNIGCGVVFCNYDGKKKYQTIVKDNVFIGSNCNLIAPVEILENSFIAAGTTVTDNIPENSFCIGRNRQIIKIRKI